MRLDPDVLYLHKNLYLCVDRQGRVHQSYCSPSHKNREPACYIHLKNALMFYQKYYPKQLPQEVIILDQAHDGEHPYGIKHLQATELLPNASFHLVEQCQQEHLKLSDVSLFASKALFALANTMLVYFVFRQAEGYYKQM